MYFKFIPWIHRSARLQSSVPRRGLNGNPPSQVTRACLGGIPDQNHFIYDSVPLFLSASYIVKVICLCILRKLCDANTIVCAAGIKSRVPLCVFYVFLVFLKRLCTKTMKELVKWKKGNSRARVFCRSVTKSRKSTLYDLWD